MFNFNIDHTNNTFHIQKSDDTTLITIVRGNFGWDQLEGTILILITQILVVPQDHQQLYDVLSYIGKVFLESHKKSRILLRLSSTFDGYIDINILNFNEKFPFHMVVNMTDLKFIIDDKSVPYNCEKYELITDKSIALDHAQELCTLMKNEAFWASNWTDEEMCERIQIASAVAVILDRNTDIACGLGRLFMVKGNDVEKVNIFGYLSDICVHHDHQGQGLGRLIVNSLINSYLSSTNKLKETNGTLCLQCADRGSGAQSAPKLYRKFGFEFFNQIENKIAIFGFESPS